jgi:hypothetical protein
VRCGEGKVERWEVGLWVRDVLERRGTGVNCIEEEHARPCVKHGLPAPRVRAYFMYDDYISAL